MTNGSHQGEAASYQGAGGANSYGTQGHDAEMGYSSILAGNHAPAESHEIDEAEQHHQQLYNNDSYRADANPEHIGNAAATEAMRSGGSMQSVVEKAISEALKFFDKSPGGGGGSTGSSNDKKSQAIEKAVKMAIKLYMANMAKQGGSGSTGSGGSSGLASMLGPLLSQAGGGHQQQQQQHQQQHSGLGGIISSFAGGSSHSDQQSGNGSSSSGGANFVKLASQFLGK